MSPDMEDLAAALARRSLNEMQDFLMDMPMRKVLRFAAELVQERRGTEQVL